MLTNVSEWFLILQELMRNLSVWEQGSRQGFSWGCWAALWTQAAEAGWLRLTNGPSILRESLQTKMIFPFSLWEKWKQLYLKSSQGLLNLSLWMSAGSNVFFCFCFWNVIFLWRHSALQVLLQTVQHVKLCLQRWIHSKYSPQISLCILCQCLWIWKWGCLTSWGWHLGSPVPGWV